MRMDPLTEQIHADRGPDGRNIIRGQRLDDRRQRTDHIFFGDDDLVMFTVQMLRRRSGVFQIDGIRVHADRKGADRTIQQAGADGTDQRGI